MTIISRNRRICLFASKVLPLALPVVSSCDSRPQAALRVPCVGIGPIGGAIYQPWIEQSDGRVVIGIDSLLLKPLSEIPEGNEVLCVQYADGYEASADVKVPGPITLRGFGKWSNWYGDSSPVQAEHEGWPIRGVWFKGKEGHKSSPQWSYDETISLMGDLFGMPKGRGSIAVTGRQMTGWLCFENGFLKGDELPSRCLIVIGNEEIASGGLSEIVQQDGMVFIRYQMGVDIGKHVVPWEDKARFRLLDRRGIVSWEALALVGDKWNSRLRHSGGR